MSFDTFMHEWLGKRVDYDHVFSYQCVDLILQYIHDCYGIGTGVWGNAIDYWTNPSAPLLTKFHRIGGNDAQEGDIVIFSGLAGNPYGHIGIATGNIDSSNVEILEQNGSTGGGSGTGEDAIRTRYVSRNRVAGLLRPITAVAPASPPVVVHPYHIEAITPKEIQINKPTHKWGLNYDNLAAINHNPEGNVNQGDVFTVNGLLHHNIGYTYYLPDVNAASGFNIADCNDYTPAPPPPPTPPPLPTPTPTLPPAAPVPIPTSTAPYQLVRSLLAYDSANDAVNDRNAKGTIPAGVYYIFNQRYGMYNLTTTLGRAGDLVNSKGGWINPAHNVVEPPPEPEPTHPPVSDWSGADPPKVEPPKEPDFRTTYQPFRNKFGEIESRYYVAMQDVPVPDLSEAKPDLLIHQYAVVRLGGTFVKDNVVYGRPTTGVEKFLWFGIPLVDPKTGVATLELEEDVYNSETDTATRKVTKTIKPRDYVVLATAEFEKTVDRFEKFFDIMKPKSRKKK